MIERSERGERAAQAIHRLIHQMGRSLLEQPGRLKSLLLDDVPDAKSEISILMRTLEEGVPQDLLRIDAREPIQTHITRLANKLQQQGFAPDASSQAVWAWANALDLGLPPQQKRQQLIIPPNYKNWALGAAAILAIGLGGWYFSQPTLAVASVQVPGGFIGDGKPHERVLSFKPGSDPVKAVLVHYTGGDIPNWTPVDSRIDVSPADAAKGQVALGTVAYRAIAPAHASFQYTLEGADGKMSKPYVQTLDISAVPASPPQITGINPPQNATPAAPFSITINFANAEFGVVKLERKVISSTLQWGDPIRTVDYTTANVQNGTLSYDFEKGVSPGTSTFEFVLIDSRGDRSQPQRVTFEVKPAPVVAPVVKAPTVKPTPHANCLCGTLLSITPIKVQGQSSGVGAVAGAGAGALAGSQFGHNAGRVLGGVLGGILGAIGGNKAEQVVRSTTEYQAAIRLDSGAVSTVRQTSQPTVEVGSRVRFANGRLVPD
jgi:outer membrane lipoprotein SlyB